MEMMINLVEYFDVGCCYLLLISKLISFDEFKHFNIKHIIRMID